MPSQKKKSLREFLKLNLRVLSTLGRAKYECLHSQRNWIIKIILTKEVLDQNYV